MDSNGLTAPCGDHVTVKWANQNTDYDQYGHVRNNPFSFASLSDQNKKYTCRFLPVYMY